MKQFIFLILSAALITGCHFRRGSGNIITQKRETSSFKGVSAGGAFEVEIKIGNTTEVIVESDDNLMPFIETRVENDVLKISTRSNNINNGHLKVFVTAPEINFIKGSGASTIKAVDPLKNGDKIRFEASGASSVSATVDAPSINAEASGASKIELSGRTRQYDAEADGSSDIKSGQLQSENTVIDASGASTVHSHASVSIAVKASGASSVYYKGAGVLKSESTGASDVKHEN